MEHYTYLAHYGIPKQKWGVRRFQNPDGSLTPEGRRRYGVGVASDKAYEKSARYKAKSDAYALKSRRALDKYDQFKSDKLKRKAEKYAVKASGQYAKAVRLSNKDDKIVNKRYSESDIYAMEGAKRAGLLGAAVGKAVGVYKERKNVKEQKRTEQSEKDNAELESKSIYDVSVNSRLKPLSQRVNDTEDQLQKICDANVKKLSDVMKSIPGRNPYDDVDSLYDGGFATELATRMNERFDVDAILDQRMDEYVHDYREGLISKKEFRQHYETELNDYSAWVVDTYSAKDLEKVAKTFVSTDGYNVGEYGDTSPKTGWKDYLKRVDSWEGVDSNSLNRQNSKASSGQLSSKQKGQISNAVADQMIRKNSSKNMSGVASAAKALRKTGNYTNEEIAKMLSLSIGELDKLLYA